MAELRSNGPYIWVTLLSKLLSGDESCEAAGWFKAQHESHTWQREPSTFDSAQWQIEHTALVHDVRENLVAGKYQVFVERQNDFRVLGKTATLAGRPDLIALGDGFNTVIDAKTGRPKDSDVIQVMLYMWALPLALPQYRGTVFDGRVAYRDREIEVPASAVDARFVERMGSLIGRLASPVSPVKVPSSSECGRCPITRADCPERAEQEDLAAVGTDAF